MQPCLVQARAGSSLYGLTEPVRRLDDFTAIEDYCCHLAFPQKRNYLSDIISALSIRSSS
jgi:hypothetical protein